MKKVLLALDQGTTSSRAIVFDTDGRVLGISQQETTQFFPHPGWVEQDAEEIWRTTRAVMDGALQKAGLTFRDVLAIGITNQRETTVLWDRATGKPVAPAIVWQCRRTAPLVEKLVQRGLSDSIREKTGLLPDAYFSGTKLQWLLQEIPGARERAERGELAFGTVDSWLLWNLTNGRVHATDYTNASRTMLFNIHTLRWDDDLLSELGIPRSLLPEVFPSAHRYAEAELDGVSIPVSGIAGDQQSALFGQCCFRPGEAKNTYGTGCFLLFETGKTPIASKSGLLTTVSCGSGKEPGYALEGSVFCGGSIISWLRDQMGLLKTIKESEEVARSVDSTEGVVLVPAFTGLGAPYWDMYARGSILGMTRGTGRAHIVRAGLEAIAYQVTDLVSAMVRDTGMALSQLRVDGGASANHFLMQFQADMLGCEVARPPMMETTALGAALLAGLTEDVWHSTDEIRAALSGAVTVFSPTMDTEKRDNLLANWHKAVERSRNWEK